MPRIYSLKDLRGHAAGHNIGGQRTNHHTSRGDQGVFPDGDALEHRDIDTQPGALLNGHRRIRPRTEIIRVPIRTGDQCVCPLFHIPSRKNFDEKLVVVPLKTPQFGPT